MAKSWLTITRRCFTSIVFLAIGVGGAAAADTDARDRDDRGNGAVYTMTNSTIGNAIVVYDRAADGTLTRKLPDIPTGGTSIGIFATGNQNGLLLSDDARCLWAVNSMSNSISAFKVKGTSLSLMDVVDSGGLRPISLTVNEDLLYVLNAGGQVGSGDNVSGFTVGKDCGLSSLRGSTRFLSGGKAGNVSPAQVGFSPTGSVLVVTEKTDNSLFTPTPGSPPPTPGGHITTFIVGRDGLLTSRKSFVPPVTEPFGFAFDNRGQLLVTGADCTQPEPPFGGLPGCLVPPDHPKLLSYKVARNGTLTLVDKSVDGKQAAECWIVITDSKKWDSQEFAFAVNALGGGTATMPLPAGSITSYLVSPNGRLAKLDVTPIPLNPLGVPVDAALGGNSRFLYVLSEGDGAIIAYKVGRDGGLTLLNTYPVETVQFPDPTAMPPVPPLFPNGLAAR